VIQISTDNWAWDLWQLEAINFFDKPSDIHAYRYLRACGFNWEDAKKAVTNGIKKQAAKRLFEALTKEGDNE